ncbi:tetratricopeptide repeat protein [bacterium]|nr:tetratricopeptide repeat protein [bacterium]MBU1994643.1 tetratricopeptide repeat protein [bacterium]
MKRSLIVALLATLLPYSLASSEPSAFGAGDISSPQPYGLTSSEKVILQNKDNLQKVVVKSNNQANEVDSLRERIDGLQSIVESLSRKSQENKIFMQNMNDKQSEELKTANEFEKRVNQVAQTNTENIEKIKLLMSELSKLLDTINANYVTKEEFNSLVNDVNKFKEIMTVEFKKKATSGKSQLDSISKADIYNSAREFYDKKNYTESIEYYTYLIDNNYKPARAHYMIGEMHYYRKNYSEAIAYFKKSASLYSEASYMPELMLHTASAMEKTGDKNNAIAFYNGIISKYPNTKYASDAQKYISLMK